MAKMMTVKNRPMMLGAVLCIVDPLVDGDRARRSRHAEDFWGRVCAFATDWVFVTHRTFIYINNAGNVGRVIRVISSADELTHPLDDMAVREPGQCSAGASWVLKVN
jgi:hypothetical protein